MSKKHEQQDVMKLWHIRSELQNVIKNSMTRVIERCNTGVVLAGGILSKQECDCESESDSKGCYECCHTKYLIVRLDGNGELITQYEYSYIKDGLSISNDLKPGDKTILMIVDNWNAQWQRVESKELCEQCRNLHHDGICSCK